jgi:hypothetical protein
LRSILRSLFVVCLLATACAGASPPPAVAQEQTLEIRSASQPFKIDDPSAKTIGRLLWRGGIMMTANSRHFGGWSDLHVSPDGKTLTSISDEGAWLTATIEYDGEANLAGLGNARIGQLHGLDGRLISSKVEADAEAMARLPDGSWLVAFERDHRLWRYRTLTATPTPVEGPAEIGRQPANGGIEALAALDDGRVIAISEEYSERNGTVMGWIGTPSAGGHYQWRHSTSSAACAAASCGSTPTSSWPAARCRPRSWRGSPRPMRSTIWRASPRPAGRAARRWCG